MDELLSELDSFDRSTPADRDRRRRLVATAAICGLAFVGIGQLATGALFVDSATATVSFATGNVAIQANGQSATILAAAAGLAPGDTVYRAVNVSNAGSLDLRYAVSGQTTVETKALSTQLKYTIWTGVSNANCATGTTGAGTVLASNATIGTVGVALVGSPLPGVQSNEQTIAAGGAADNLCVAMNLPLATTNAFASASATVVLTFDAEQTKNN
jgi:hypothetical protein